MKTNIIDIEEVGMEVWDNFVESHQEANIFQTSYMYSVFKETRGYEPIAIAATDNEGKICGIVSGFVVKYSSLFSRAMSRSVVCGGPIVDGGNTECFRALMEAYDTRIKHKTYNEQIRNINDLSAYFHILESLGYSYEAHLNYLIDLSKDEVLLWKAMSAAARNKVNKARREKLVFRELSIEEMQSAYTILGRVYHRIGYPLADISLFKKSFELSRDRVGVVVFGAYKDNVLVAVRFILCYGRRWYDWYAGSNEKYKHCAPNDFLVWNILLKAKALGAEVYDMGGAGSPSFKYSVRDFKKKFGGTEVCYGRYEKYRIPIIKHIIDIKKSKHL